MTSTAPAFEPIHEALPREERIRRRAYELYLNRGGQPGSEADDWRQAEAEELPVEEKVNGVNGFAG
jgi:hypothetical protein